MKMTAEQIVAKQIAIEMARHGISTVEQISDWFDQLNTFLVFHPDTRFTDYVQLGTGGKVYTFTRLEADSLDAAMTRAFALCDQNGKDIYELCIRSAQRMGVAPLSWEDATDDMKTVELANGAHLCVTHGYKHPKGKAMDYSMQAIDAQAVEMTPEVRFPSREAAEAAAPAYIRQHHLILA